MVVIIFFALLKQGGQHKWESQAIETLGGNSNQEGQELDNMAMTKVIFSCYN